MRAPWPAADMPRLSIDLSHFEYLMDADEVEYWTGCNVPAILILVHLERG
jgi:hypothetical protein